MGAVLTVAVTALLDSNILFSAGLRNVFMWLSIYKTYQPKWSKQINDEWTGRVIEKYPDITKRKIKRTLEQMLEANPDAVISGFEEIIPKLTLPDKKDRHVLAAAIQGHCRYIVTINLGDFPTKTLEKYDIEPINPDDFIYHLMTTTPETVSKALLDMHKAFKNPPVSLEFFMRKLEKIELKKSIAHWKSIVLVNDK